MQHLRILGFSLVVANFVFRIEGFPPGDNDHKQKSGVKKTFSLLCGIRGIDGDSTGKTSTGIIDVGNGITIGADCLVKGLGPSTAFPICSLAKALSSVTRQSLTKSLGLPDKTSGGSACLGNVLVNLVVAQSVKPISGRINYETAIVVVQMLHFLEPETSKALKVLCFVIERVKQVEDGRILLNSDDGLMIIIREGMMVFGVNFDRKTEVKWTRIQLDIILAFGGDMNAAKDIICTLTDRGTALEGTHYACGMDSTFLREVIDEVVNFAHLLKRKTKNIL